MTKNTNKKKRVRKQMERSQTNYLSAARVLQQKSPTKRVPTPWSLLNKSLLGGGLTVGVHAISMPEELHGKMTREAFDQRAINVLFLETGYEYRDKESYQNFTGSSRYVQALKDNPSGKAKNITTHYGFETIDIPLDEWSKNIEAELVNMAPRLLVISSRSYEGINQDHGAVTQVYIEQLKRISHRFQIPVVVVYGTNAEKYTVEDISQESLNSSIIGIPDENETQVVAAFEVVSNNEPVVATPWDSLNTLLKGGYRAGFHTLTLTEEQRLGAVRALQDNKEVRVLLVSDWKDNQYLSMSLATRGEQEQLWIHKPQNHKYPVLDEWVDNLVADFKVYEPDILVVDMFKNLYEHYGRSNGTMIQAYADKLDYIAKKFSLPIVALRVDESEHLHTDTIRYRRLTSAVTAEVDEVDSSRLSEFRFDVPRQQDASSRVTLPWESVNQLYQKDGTAGLQPGLHIWASSYHFNLEDIAAIAAYDGNQGSLMFTALGEFNNKTYKNEIFMKRDIPVFQLEDHTIRGAYNPTLLQHLDKEQLLGFISKEKTRKYPTQLLVLNQSLTNTPVAEIIEKGENLDIAWSDDSKAGREATRVARRVWTEDLFHQLHKLAVEQSFPILLLEEIAGVGETSVESIVDESLAALQKQLHITDSALEQVATFTYVSPHNTPDKAIRFTQATGKQAGESALVPWNELY